MASQLTNIDAINIYRTGADARGNEQFEQSASLGGKWSGGGAFPQCFIPSAAQIPNIRIHRILGANGTGVGTIRAKSANTLTWTAPGDTEGAAVTVGTTWPVLLESNDPDKAIRVFRTSATDLAGEMDLTLTAPLNDVFAMSNVANADRVAGLSTYRAVMLRAHAAVTDIKAWVGTLGTQRTTDGAQLGASGAGTITTTGSFADWPASGWAHVKDSGGATREIVYYTARTATSLTVPAAGRGLLGTSADAGASDDTVDAVPGIRLAFETQDADGDIQTIANETTAPTGVTWDSGTTAATGLSQASLAAGDNHGLWIHRQIPAGATVAAFQQTKIHVQFVYGGNTYDEVMSSYYRIEDTTLAAYEVYLGEDADPDLTATPDATSATLPFTVALAAPVSGETEYRYVVRQRNAYDLVSLNRYHRVQVVDSNGDAVETPLQTPQNVTLVNTAGGYLDVGAEYFPGADDDPADTWAIYVRGNETDPDPSTDTAITETMGSAGVPLRPWRKLNYRLGPYAKNNEIRAIVQARRVGDSFESGNTGAVTTTVTTLVPAKPRPHVNLGASHRQIVGYPTISRTVYVDQPNNIRWELSDGTTEFWADADIIFRIRYDSGGTATNNGFWTTYSFIQEVISGTPSSTPVEVASTTLFYFTSAGTRRLKIDKTAGTIHAAALRQVADEVLTTRDDDPAHELDWSTGIQVWDRFRYDYYTVASLDPNGKLALRVPWKQVATTGDFG